MKLGGVAVAVVLVLVLAGCGGGDDAARDVGTPDVRTPAIVVRPVTCDYTVLGACVVSLVQKSDPSYIERYVKLALAYWGAPDDTLAGWAIVFNPEGVPCPTALGSGCTWWDENKTIELQALDPKCLETSQIVHEIGHVLHQDPGHEGPWWSWTREQDATWDIVHGAGASPGCATTRYYAARP